VNGEEKRWFYNDEHKVEAIALKLHECLVTNILHIIRPLSQIAAFPCALLFILLSESINFEFQNNLQSQASFLLIFNN
jgi:hypothetical protein